MAFRTVLPVRGASGPGLLGWVYRAISLDAHHYY